MLRTVLASHVDENRAGLLYGKGHPGAEKLADEILENLRKMSQDEILVVSLEGVLVMDTGFAESVYDALLGGQRTDFFHTRFCRLRSGKGIVFTHVEPHLENIRRAVDEARDVIVYATPEGVEFEGAPLDDPNGPTASVYQYVLDRGTMTAGDLVGFLEKRGFGKSPQNAQKILTALWNYGLLVKHRAVTDAGASYRFYTPVNYEQFSPLGIQPHEEEARAM